MTHRVAANYVMPAILDTLKPMGMSGATKAASASSAGTNSTSATSGGMSTTFLNLLVKELQHQDPTAPMDSTAMVGQMISLNQLDQLISINQKTTAISGTGTKTGTTQPAGGAANVAANGNATAMPSSPDASAAKSQLPYLNPSMLMPFDPALSRAGSLAHSANSPLNAATMGYPGFDNTLGGK